MNKLLEILGFFAAAAGLVLVAISTFNLLLANEPWDSADRLLIAVGLLTASTLRRA